ncbi:MAG: TetR/AcrR family transcriptional regulator [Anaerolineae bacterium]|jgi:AcrR family transcriptional regulator|nr:TetR/AcrR family transcriptional regulator [Anaerolineae bacterium]
MPEEKSGYGLERLLHVAETLFMERGYSAVKLRHIAQELGIKESSIYYHFPQGKESLFIAVMNRNFARHHAGIKQAIGDAGEDWVAQLRAVGHWLISQPPIDVMRMSKSDLPSIDSVASFELEEGIYEAVNAPIRQILERANLQGKANIPDCDLVAGIFVGMVSSIDVIKGAWNPKSKMEMVDILIDTWVNGLVLRR